jgi:hypothetical protein
MDGTLAIENNLQALKRILAGLVGMAGLRQSAIGNRQSVKADGAENSDCPLPTADCRPLLPRHLRLAILRLLRPAESAARRLIVAAARGLVVTLPPPRARKPKPAAPDPLLRRFGIAVTLSPADTGALASRQNSGTGAGRREASGCDAPLSVALPLFDPPRRFRRSGRTVPPHAGPRIGLPGVTERRPLPAPPAPDDPIDATRLNLRLAALASALDDVAGQARRFARLQARRKQAPARRIWPLRPGRPPGGRLARYDPSALHPRGVREVDEILAHAHALAFHALRPPDSS